MNVCFMSYGERHNETLLPLLRLTGVRLYSLFSSHLPTMGNNIPDRITFDVSDCCAACHLKSSLTSLSSLFCLGPSSHIYVAFSYRIYFALHPHRGGSGVAIVLGYCVLSTSANYFRAHCFSNSE